MTNVKTQSNSVITRPELSIRVQFRDVSVGNVQLSLERYSTPCPKKTKQICFCQNFVKVPPILIIFGRKMGNDPNICELHSFSTSPNLRHHLTVLNANVPNCYIN